ncbi:MAG TPA: dihydrolipoyl dehydrogenase [bacterium]|nr:dihydrolipoyl dehydrogenase [bacterium]
MNVVIIGGGPGGYVAALRGAQLGLNVTLIEDDKVGGVCLNRGCIPTKALLSASEKLVDIKSSSDFGIEVGDYKIDINKIFDRKDQVVNQLVKGVEYLLSTRGVKLVKGRARLVSQREVQISTGEIISGDVIIIATGSLPITSIGNLKIDNDRVISSDYALSTPHIPREIVIIGAGAIGVEFATFYKDMGADVSIVEMMSRVVPNEDEEISKTLERVLKRKGIKLYLNNTVKEITEDGVILESGELLRAEKVLVAVGRKPNTDGLGLENAGIKTNNRGYIEVDEYLKTNVPNIYAIGDVTGIALFAHLASHQGIIAIENILGKKKSIDYNAVPRATFCEPQIGSVGLTEGQARANGINPVIGRFPFRALGYALAIGKWEGMVKLIADESKELIGAHIIGPYASNLLGEVTLAVKEKMRLEDIAETIHAHPTLPEAIMEASFSGLNLPLHIV